jgi:hypothetical protein
VVLTTLDGLSGIFWLFLNKGKWFASPKKIFLTVLNIIIVGIGACLVGFFVPYGFIC